MIWYFWKKWKLHVHKNTIFKILKRKRSNKKKNRRIDERQNENLRMHWIAELLNVVTKQLIYIDESLFNETTNWRLRNWAPIEQKKKYHANRRKNHAWNVLPAYTLNGYLPCTAIKKEWFNGEELYDWIANQLLPQCNAFPAPRSANKANVDASDNVGRTALHYAARQGSAHLVRLLLTSQALVEKRDFDRQTALDYAIERDRTAVIQILRGEPIWAGFHSRR